MGSLELRISFKKIRLIFMNFILFFVFQARCCGLQARSDSQSSCSRHHDQRCTWLLHPCLGDRHGGIDGLHLAGLAVLDALITVAVVDVVDCVVHWSLYPSMFVQGRGLRAVVAESFVGG